MNRSKERNWETDKEKVIYPVDVEAMNIEYWSRNQFCNHFLSEAETGLFKLMYVCNNKLASYLGYLSFPSFCLIDLIRQVAYGILLAVGLT